MSAARRSRWNSWRRVASLKLDCACSNAACRQAPSASSAQVLGLSETLRRAQVIRFLRRRCAAQHAVAMRETAEAAHDGRVQLGVLENRLKGLAQHLRRFAPKAPVRGDGFLL